jgi:hypothetical protein
MKKISEKSYPLTMGSKSKMQISVNTCQKKDLVRLCKRAKPLDHISMAMTRLSEN